MIPLNPGASSLAEIEPTVSRPAALPDRIYAILKHRILTCSMRPGEKIVEAALCQEMHVSRTPLREAFNRLSLEGLIEMKPYRGFAVAPVTVSGYKELCEFRRIVESGSAGLAAERATPEAIERLLAVAETRYTMGDRATYNGYLRANSAFHLELVRATGNRQIESVVMSALDRHQRPLYLGLDEGVDAAASTAEHFAIVEAVRRRDSALAADLMARHIGKAEDRIAKAMEAAGY
ncbi:MAG: GntR family transcriptional regulator [Vicinamibacteria bacterium]|nr:GntR family transcriptional regulator [Vicinamibacteria bacterium]